MFGQQVVGAGAGGVGLSPGGRENGGGLPAGDVRLLELADAVGPDPDYAQMRADIDEYVGEDRIGDDERFGGFKRLESQLRVIAV